MGDCIPTLIRGEYFWRVGDQGALGRAVSQHQFQELRVGITFDIELSGNGFLEERDVVVANMPLVRTRVDGNALCTEGFAIAGNLYEIRKVATPCVA
jgi:hypothetical protein